MSLDPVRPDPKNAALDRPWRTGRTVGRTIYAMAHERATDEDVLIGMLDTPALAAEAVRAHNHGFAPRA